MTWFPQMSSGTLTQLPIQKSRKWRAIRNELENGERILLPDTASGQIEWRLTFRELNDNETRKLADFFAASQGRYGAFGFADPLANLIGWSEDLSKPDWQMGLMAATSGVSDPLGNAHAWAVSNGSAGTQELAQTVGVSGEYTGCFSAWLRSAAPSTVSLRRDGVETSAAIGPVWRRYYVSGTGAQGAGESTTGISIAPGQSVEVWALQFEAQPYPSQYKQTLGAAGVYEETYFGNDELSVTSTGVGLSSCEITLLSRI